MLTYIKPTITSCGASESVIKGECSWGTENLAFDKANTTKGHTRTYTYTVACYGPGVVNTCRRCGTNYNACSTDVNEC